MPRYYNFATEPVFFADGGRTGPVAYPAMVPKRPPFSSSLADADLFESGLYADKKYPPLAPFSDVPPVYEGVGQSGSDVWIRAVNKAKFAAEAKKASDRKRIIKVAALVGVSVLLAKVVK